MKDVCISEKSKQWLDRKNGVLQTRHETYGPQAAPIEGQERDGGAKVGGGSRRRGCAQPSKGYYIADT